MSKVFLKLRSKLTFVIVIIASVFLLMTNVYAENVDVSISYGIQNIAKSGQNFPVELVVENRDGQDFVGYMTLNVFENNQSTFIYRIDLNIPAKTTSTYNRDISISNKSSAILINIFNKKEEIVSNERINIDLSYYSDRLIIGALTSDFNTLSYIDNLVITNTTIQTKLVRVSEDDILRNESILNLLDVLLINDVNLSDFDEKIEDAIYKFVYSGKALIIGIGTEYGTGTVPNFLDSYVEGNIRRTLNRMNFNLKGSRIIETFDDGTDIELLKIEEGIVVCTPYSFKSLSYSKESGKEFLNFFDMCFDKNRIIKYTNSFNSILNNDYYNISNIIHMIDKEKLPDIFVITALLVFYILFITIIIYVFLRNVNKRERYGKYALIFSLIYTFVMFSIGYSVMKKNTFLTYLSIVNIKDANAREMAFLNFRTSESGGYEFDTSKEVRLSPILRNNKEPIVSFDFINMNEIKTTTFTEDAERKIVTVENAKNFDSNLFLYENSNYLNDVYNVTCSYRRFDGEVTGRISNNMNIAIKNAFVLLHGKVLNIGDIESNHSILLSRAKDIGAPLANNSMLSDMISEDINKNIIKYYLDENVSGYYDYGLLLGFIDNNGTMDINSTDVGDVYGRTLLVTKINKDLEFEMEDICSLENNVNNIDGYYDYETNTISGDVDVINEYTFNPSYNITKVYFETLSNYDHGDLNFNVPFYGEIELLNLKTNKYDSMQSTAVSGDNLRDYLSNDNKIVIKFSPSSRDPLYRRISLPIFRAIGLK